MKIWFEVISDLFVNIAAAWFVVVFVEPQIDAVNSFWDIRWLLLKLLGGIISLLIAKYLREKSRRIKR